MIHTYLKINGGDTYHFAQDETNIKHLVMWDRIGYALSSSYVRRGSNFIYDYKYTSSDGQLCYAIITNTNGFPIGSKAHCIYWEKKED